METSDDENDNNKFCLICKEQFSDLKNATCVTKGLENLKKFAQLRKRDDILDYINLQERKKELGDEYCKVFVHPDCRKVFVNIKRILKTQEQEPTRTPKKTCLRKSSTFDWKLKCFYCTKNVYFDIKHQDRTISSRRVQGKADSVSLIDKIRNRCIERDDKWGVEVKSRIETVVDLVAAEAVYHTTCEASFMKNNPKKKTRGRPVNLNLVSALDELYEFLENENELFTLTDLHDKFKDLVGDNEVFVPKYIKQKLIQKYGDRVFFAEINGRKNIVCFHGVANSIINDKWYSERKSNNEDEAERIMMTAAKIVKNEIKQFLHSDSSKTVYPSPSDVEDLNFVPKYLKTFLGSLIKSDIKVEAIGQSIMKSAFPKSLIAPALLSLSIELDHMFGSRWLLTQLYKLGFCEHYSEVVRFKQSVVTNQNVEELLKSRATEDCFVTFIGDNVDHNIATLDGKGTFHGMGVIAAITNAGEFKPVHRPRVRPKDLVKIVDLVKNKGISITAYDYPNGGLETIKFKSNVTEIFESSIKSDYDRLWDAAGLLNANDISRPNWNGFMQKLEHGSHPRKAEVVMLPIIDLNPNDETCIYSVLLFIIEQSKNLGIKVPSITFDQPLWIKALEIITAKKLEIVPLLGGFHMLMSFYGSIGTIMDDSGISNLFETVYGSNAVKHILSGKAISRANRAHILAASALMIKLQKMAIDDDLTSDINLDLIKDLYKEVVDGNNLDIELQIPEIMKLEKTLEEFKIRLKNKSRTAKLWIQYIDYVDIAKDFIRAARTGHWKLHLESVRRMINLFAATGHINYAKSARIYLQLMLELPTTHSWLDEKFTDGLFVIRRSNRFWAGLWPDLVIEQVMMKSIKSRGGLTRGSGMTENVRTTWIYSLHETAAYHQMMTSLTGNSRSTSEQHVELGGSRLRRDLDDLSLMQKWLDFQSHNPFEKERSNLQSLGSGLIADETVNCDRAEEIGKLIQKKLDNIPVSEAVIKRKDKAVTLASLKPSILIEDDPVVIDPLVLFSRLIILIQRSTEIQNYFRYELAPIPTSLFKDWMMRKPNKSSLAKALDKKVKKELEEDTETENESVVSMSTCDDDTEDETDLQTKHLQNECFVIDGGYLLHRVVWVKFQSYGEIAYNYNKLIKSRYGEFCTIIFDGYENGPSTKDHEHLRRMKKTVISPDVSVEAENQFIASSQKSFLSNMKNKQSFINLLSDTLERCGHKVIRSSGDADRKIVSEVISEASENNVTLIGADTDLLIMLLYFWNDDYKNIYFRTDGTRKNSAKNRSIREMSSCLKPILEFLTFLHAFTGCDTTSATFGFGKVSIMRALEKKKFIRDAARVFLNPGSTQEQIGSAGSKIFVYLYGGKSTDGLSILRYNKYMSMLAKSSKIKPESLPPSERAAYFHSLRVYLQVQEWNDSAVLRPDEWGWKMKNGAYIPIMTDAPPAPDDILNVTRCNCKISSKNPCGSNSKCSCRANGLLCVPACGDCRGVDCSNCGDFIEEEDDTENEDLPDILF